MMTLILNVLRRARAWIAPTLCALVVGCGGDNPTGPGAGPEGTGSPPLAFDDFHAAELAIGQPSLNTGRANAGGTVNAVGLIQPIGAGGGTFYVVDHLNNRVLGFLGLPTADGQPADFVLGQQDLTSNAYGSGTLGLKEPTVCGVDGGRLFVVDSGNARVLVWHSLPTSDAPADVVVGQPDFDSFGVGPTASVVTATSHAAMGGGKLVISDGLNHRILIWNSVPRTNGAPADVVLGQTDFTSAAPGLTASRLQYPGAVWTDGKRLVVADAGNSRVLIWNTFPTASAAPADVVVGAPDFVTAGTGAASATSIGPSMGVASDGTSLFATDQSHHRVLIYSPIPATNGAAATGVLGQASFTASTYNDANQDGRPDSQPSARTFAVPAGVSVVGDYLLVADLSNSRVLAFKGR